MKHDKSHPLKCIQGLSSPLSDLRGIGPKRAALLALKGLYTILDLMYFTPVRYEDRTKITPINRAEEGSQALVRGRVLYGKELKFIKSRKKCYRILINDGEGSIELLWFRYKKPHLDGVARVGNEVLAYGTFRMNQGKRQMIHPDISMSYGQEASAACGFFPVYSHIQGISGTTLRSLVRNTLDTYVEDLVDPLPEELLNGLGLPGLRQAISRVHFPSGESTLETLNRLNTPFHRRLLFDRFFYVMLAMRYRKMRRIGTAVPALRSLIRMEEISGYFGFKLTSSQLKAVEEIAEDLCSRSPMNRLLMGDVGTGKTVVSAIAAYVITKNNKQAALMAPTIALASQHMEFFSGLPKEMGFRPVLLTRDLKGAGRDNMYQRIREGDFNLIIGTHSLIQGGLTYADLGLAMIDEQHRFGVRQRALIDKKGHNPHILFMSATPIPRTLAIACYGDMDISVIEEYPKGHIPVRTCVVEDGQKKWAFETLKQKIAMGQQAFFICPVIEESEETDLKSAQEMERRLKKALSPPYRIGMIHGRLPTIEKERVMRDFRKARIDLLVATTVIEVGLHIPNATVMIIEHPERFGLAQLHQLRGRIGRGTRGGICMLMTSPNLPERTKTRLKILVESHNGFEIAQRDLDIRGPGEFTGTRQAGIGEMEIDEVIRHPGLLLKAKRAAQELMESDPGLIHPSHRYLKAAMESIMEMGLSS